MLLQFAKGWLSQLFQQSTVGQTANERMDPRRSYLLHGLPCLSSSALSRAHKLHKPQQSPRTPAAMVIRQMIQCLSPASCHTDFWNTTSFNSSFSPKGRRSEIKRKSESGLFLNWCLRTWRGNRRVKNEHFPNGHQGSNKVCKAESKGSHFHCSCDPTASTNAAAR